MKGWRFWQIDERIYWLYKPAKNKKIGTELKSNHALLTSIWRFPPERNNPHPAPFPLRLPLRCILSILDKTEKAVVIDPYIGSGTTALAAKLLGYSFIGIDISPQYIALAKKRLQELHAYTEILRQEKEKHFVRKTFEERKANGDFTGRFSRKEMANTATIALPLKTLF